jgi:hypothetical protein
MYNKSFFLAIIPHGSIKTREMLKTCDVAGWAICTGKMGLNFHCLMF